MIKRYLFTGLALLLPVVVTLLILIFFVNLLTKPFQSLVEDVLSYYGLLGKPFLFLSASQVLHLTSKLLILLTLIAVVVVMGLLAQMFITKYFIRLGDFIIHRIPIINKIYKAAQDVVSTLFADNRRTFSQVVLVPFPHEKSYSIGMVTNETLTEDSESEHAGMISVFVPATPNPTMGFMLFLKKSQVTFLDMKVDDALKAIISCGVLVSEISEMENK